MIPVILNGVDMTKVAPPHSYIDIKDFNNFNGRYNIQKNTYDIEGSLNLNGYCFIA